MAFEEIENPGATMLDTLCLCLLANILADVVEVPEPVAVLGSSLVNASEIQALIFDTEATHCSTDQRASPVFSCLVGYCQQRILALHPVQQS